MLVQDLQLRKYLSLPILHLSFLFSSTQQFFIFSFLDLPKFFLEAYYLLLVGFLLLLMSPFFFGRLIPRFEGSFNPPFRQVFLFARPQRALSEQPPPHLPFIFPTRRYAPPFLYRDLRKAIAPLFLYPG